MPNSQIIKNAIAEGTKDLIRHNSIDNITVTEICEKTGMNRRTFYRYFSDKFDVVDWIYYHDALVNFEHYDGWSAYDYMPRIMRSLYNDRAYYVNALKYKGQNSFRDYCTVCLRKLFEKDYAGVFAEKWELDFFIDHICEMTYDVCINWLSSEPCMPPEEFTGVYCDFLLKAFSFSSQLMLRTPAQGAKEITVQHREPSKRTKGRKLQGPVNSSTEM